tara:strand:- start:116 stop:904 length:789 start_codon:yes stop_codon:yes gene_type:complete
MANIATESGHWYAQDGSAMHTVIAKGNGLERPTTLGDARKLGLVPSVTNILNLQAKPFLSKWLQDQIFDACVLLPIMPNEEVSDYKKRVYEEAERYSNERREEGTAIHSAIDRGFLYQEDNIYYNSVKAIVEELYPNRLWMPEVPFAHKLGFGGKADLSSNQNADGSEAYPLVIDYKSKEFADDAKAKKFIYDDHGLQLSAYGLGLFECVSPIRLNIFVRPTDGKCLPYLHDENNDLDKFIAILDLWKLMKGYDSSFINEGE